MARPEGCATTRRGGCEVSWVEWERSWGLRGFVGRAGNAELFQAAAEGVGVKTEDGGRAARPVDDPIRLAQDREDVVPLNILQRGRRPVGGFRISLTEEFGIDLQRGASREDGGALEDVLQLADVARPRVRHQPAECRRVDAVKPPGDPRRELVEEVLRQQRNILGPLAERRELDREDAEPVVQVFAERLLADGLLEVAVGGGDDPDVDLSGATCRRPGRTRAPARTRKSLA